MSPALLVSLLVLFVYVARRIARWYAWARACARLPTPAGATWIAGHAKPVADPQ